MLARACPHCGSPARQNPCWWFVRHPELSPSGGDPPCEDDRYTEDSMKRRKRFGLSRLLLTLVAIAVLSLIIYFGIKSAGAQGASCVRHGVPAVCRSPAIERQAKAIVLRQCPRCDRRKVADAIYSFQMNRGPYESAAELARDVLQQVKP